MTKITSITPLGSGVYSVSSPNEQHTVDIGAYGWNGSCTCRVFTACARFILKHQGESESRESTRCDHILACREFAMEHEYPLLIERAEKIIELPTSQTANEVIL